MRKITIILLVAMVPFLTIAQKKSKKSSKSEKIVTSYPNYDFLVIRAIEFNEREISNSVLEDMDRKTLVKLELENLRDVSYMIVYDFGAAEIQDIDSKLMRRSGQIRSISEAVSAAANNGWEFQSSNVVVVGDTRIHYCYMKRNK